ncbi:hypothetical protein [Infirmifilum sp.]|jgi:hypothetical protein|uniref:hypothetical protein n=1 Tax=Infirmifilum sp. TaxID=2856575 RepID=UPI003D0BD953
MSELAQRGQAEVAKKKRCVALDAQTLVAAVHEVYRVPGVWETRRPGLLTST